ncbi:MAG: GAF domain-containing protein, partial [Chloroflexi bacterium]|nr:GAF domain-containing protein [Chloroflexota bacterium]
MVVKKRSSKPKSTKRTPNKSSNENAILAEIGRIVNSSELIDDVYAQVESQISKLISYDRLRVNVIDNETSLLRTVFASGLDVPQHTIGTLMPLQGTPALKALETNQVQVIQGLDEAELLDEYPNMAERYRAGLRSFMVAPLVFNGATVGSIGFFSSHSDAYSSDDASMAGRIGSQLSGAIEISKLSGERTRAEEGERRLIEQNAAVAQIGRIINSSLLIDEVYERFVDVVKGLLPFDRISITSADFSIGEARTTYVSGIEMPGRSAGEVFPVDGTPAQHVYKNGGPVAARSAGVVTSASIEALSVPQDKRGIKSFIAVPLQTRNEIVGVLQIHSVVPDIYRDWHVQLLSTIADQISGAIANSELHAEVFESRESQKRLAEDNASIAEIGRILNSTLVIEDVFELIGKQIEGLISFDRLRINLLDEKSDSMTIAYVSGVEFPNFGIENSVPMENSSSQTAMQSGQVDVIQGVDHLQLSDTNPSLIPAIKSGLRSFMFVPLVSEDKPIGTIALLSIQESAFSDRDISTAQQVASQISTAISNAQLYSQITEAGEAQRRLADEHAAVAEIGRIINSSSEISEVYPQFCEVVSKLLPCDRLSITMADLEKDEGFAAYEWGIEVKGRAPGVVFPLRGSLIGRILENPTPFCHGVTGSPKLAEQVQLTDRQKDAGVQSFIGVPMRSNNQTIGTLVIHSREANAYDERHIHLLSTIANQISGAISNSQLYARAVQSEKSLRASENELRILFESTASGILTINDRGVIESLNHAVEDIFGYTSDELVGQSVTVLMPAPFRDEHKGYLSNYLSTGKSRVIGIDRELTGLRKDGGVFPIELVVHDMEMDGQQFFTGIIRDISERVKAEEETRRLATIVESANDPIIAVDTKRRINVWNPAAEDLYGYAPEEVL